MTYNVEAVNVANDETFVLTVEAETISEAEALAESWWECLGNDPDDLFIQGAIRARGGMYARY